MHGNITKRWNSDEMMMKKMRKIGRWKHDEEIHIWQISTCESRYFKGYGKVQWWQKDEKLYKRGLKDEKRWKDEKMKRWCTTWYGKVGLQCTYG